MFESIHTILWDFDGVILDSVPVRDAGYWHVLNHYPDEQVKKLIRFQQQNGGLSRYVKFRYFYEEILGREISEEKVNEYAAQYSGYMIKNLIDPDLLIQDTMNFIRANYQKYTMHIVSGSDQQELRYLCSRLNIDRYFQSIHGSPTPKTELVSRIIDHYDYDPGNMVLIGDSINDYDAAIHNHVSFYGYNNDDIRDKGDGYITSFQ
jgi:phosphoglycolate phosphatase-like HAD superfamily hydrolase